MATYEEQKATETVRLETRLFMLGLGYMKMK